jgi:Site-specific recombinase XerD
MNGAKHRSLEPLSPERALELYLQERQTEAAESTVKARRYRLGHFVRWCDEEGLENVNELTGRLLHEYRLWRREDGDLNKVSVKSQMDTLRVFIRWCETIDAVEPDLSTKVLSPNLSNGENQRDVMLEADEAEDLLNYLTRFDYASLEHTLLLLLWKTGMRVGAAQGLDIEDYDSTEGTLVCANRGESKFGLDYLSIVAKSRTYLYSIRKYTTPCTLKRNSEQCKPFEKS